MNEIELACMTLYYKAKESMMSFPLFIDTQAISLSKDLFQEYPIEVPKEFEYVGQLSVACRAKLIDDILSTFEGKKVRILNFGCGFDVRGYQASNWFDIDLPEVMNKRLEYLPEEYKGFNIAGDIKDIQFILSLTSREPTIVILEGVLDYFAAEDVYQLFALLKQISPEVTVIFDTVGSLLKGVNPPILASVGIDTKIQFGLDNPKDVETFQYKVESCTYIYEVDKYRWKVLAEEWKKEPRYKNNSSKVIVLKGVNE